MKKKENLHIEILKYGKDKLESRVIFEDLCTHIEEQGYRVRKDRMESYFYDTYETRERKNRASPELALEQRDEFSLTVESTFRLIEYEALESANKHASRATWFATSALLASIISIVIAFYRI